MTVLGLPLLMHDVLVLCKFSWLKYMTGVHSEKLGWVVSFQLTLVTSLSLLGRLSIVWALWMLLPCLMIPPGGGGRH